MESNYEKQVYQSREIYQGYDQRTLAKKFGLSYDGSFLYLEMLKEEYRISDQDGSIEKRCPEGWQVCLDYQKVMTLYDILCHSGQSSPQLSGQWCQISSLQATGSIPSTDWFTRKYAKKFSGRTETLAEICRRLGAEMLSVPASADVCCKIPFFSFFPVIFQFWDGDEEFSPKISLLWDRNALQFLHFETLYYAIGVLMERLASDMEGFLIDKDFQ